MKKGISLVALVITIVVLIILTGTIILSTMNNNIFDNTNSTVNEYNKKVIIEDVQMKIQTKKLKRANQGIYTITMEEIIPIIQEHGTFNNNILKLTTTKGIEIWLYEIIEIPLEEYATITYENSILTIQTELTNNGYRVQYTTDAGSSWSLYNNPVTISEESGIQIRLINEQGQVVSNTLKITGGVIGELDNISPTITIEPNGIGLAKNTQVTITVTDNNELANYNTYEYYLSTSSTTQVGGSWTTYTNGTAFTIGTNLTGTYYLHVKQIYDKAGNTSGNVVSQSYTFDNTAPYSFTPTVLSKTTTSLTIKANTSDNNGQAVTYKYSKDNGETWQESNTFDNLTSGTTYSVQVKAIDTLGNEYTSNSIIATTNTTLADLITGATEYGYSVSGYTANGVSAWSVFYEDLTNGYVFLISTNNLGNQSLTLDDATGVTTANSSSVYKIFKLGASGYTLNGSYNNCKAVAYLVNDFGAYASPTNSKITSYVVGAIGGPTIELFVAAYKAKVGTNIPIGTSTYGYTVNGTYFQKITNDGFYSNSGYSYWLASPSNGAATDDVIYVGGGYVENYYYYGSYGLRPVVCLKSNCPAYMNGSTIVIGN